MRAARNVLGNLARMAHDGGGVLVIGRHTNGAGIFGEVSDDWPLTQKRFADPFLQTMQVAELEAEAR